jgi:hypothetical protein
MRQVTNEWNQQPVFRIRTGRQIVAAVVDL